MNPIRPHAAGALLLVLTAAAPAEAQKTPTTPPVAAPTAAEKTALTRGRTLMKEFYAVKLDNLWNAFNADVRGQWGTLAGFRQFRETGVRDFGAEQELVRERTFTRAGVTYYVRSAAFQKAPKLVWALTIGFDKAGKVDAFGISLEQDRTEDQVARGDVGRNQ
ncbi:hypothetical protein [Deinococcus puniceus]|uniref:DUF3887 domain-containing protein n=1 Tax=Deinococcus puniceus TaxID=1182568 RepID=A0A172TBC9_9DEIO|nr:hypothetical protein [Deinococcus puniceus]ANE44227.1 hypothetical protein SU48_11150 [Deinococcus puniceus]